MIWHSMLTVQKGVSCQAWLSGELFLRCYAKNSPIEDVVHSICRSAFLVGLARGRSRSFTEETRQFSQKGRYGDAIARMQEIDEEALRTLRYSQYWTANLGLLKLRKHLHRSVFSPSSGPSTNNTPVMTLSRHRMSSLSYVLLQI